MTHIDQGVASTLPGGTSTIGGTFTAPYSAITSGRKTVAVAGTAEALGGSVTTKCVIVTALQTNSEVIAVGGSTVLADPVTRNGTPMYPGQSLVLFIDNLSKIFIDAVTAGDGVAYNYFT